MTHLLDLLEVYWEAAYAEGKAGREHDTAGALAQQTLMAIRKDVAAQVEAGIKARLLRSRCLRCNWAMKPGKAIEQTYTGSPEWTGACEVTMSPGGPGRLIDCLKCELCGCSVSCQPQPKPPPGG